MYVCVRIWICELFKGITEQPLVFFDQEGVYFEVVIGEAETRQPGVEGIVVGFTSTQPQELRFSRVLLR